jgi:hypothetical protein
MKTHRVVSHFLGIFLSLIISGCLGFEIKTTTQVNSDGSILRTMVITGDSANIFNKHNFPLALDSTWDIQIDKNEKRLDSTWCAPKNEKEKSYMLKATRLFQTVDDANKTLFGTEGKNFIVHLALEKQFQWFFTTFKYRETYRKFNLLEKVPLKEYLSPAEFNLQIQHDVKKEPFPTKGDSLAFKDASKRIDLWYKRNQFEAYYAIFIEGVRIMNNPSFSPESVAVMKEELFEQSTPVLNIDNKPQLVFAKVLKKAEVKKVFSLQAKEYESLKQKDDFQNSIYQDEFTVNVIMPGLIANTNANNIEGNKVSWKEFINYCYYGDYEMWVESRVVNWWAVILSGVIVLALLVGMITAVFRRRRAF